MSQQPSPPPEARARRRFLRMSAVPLGSLFLGACGGGGESAAAEPVPTSSNPLVTPPPATPAPTPVEAPAPPVPAPPAPEPVPAPAPTSPPVEPQPEPPTTAFEPMPRGPLPAWVSAQPLWRWFEIPDTRLSSVAPTPTPLGWTGPRAKIDTWCGATVKRTGSVYMLGAAGGHGDYAGNEVNALTLNTERPAWAELRGPTPNDQIIGDVQFLLDGRPSSTHTYYATQFIDATNRMVVIASRGAFGQAYPIAPQGYPYTGSLRSYSFNLDAGDWDGPDAMAQFPGMGGTNSACLCAKHPVTGDVYYSRNGGDGFYRWSPATNTWTRQGTRSRSSWYAGSAIDPRRNRMLVVGSYSATAPLVLDLRGEPVAVTFTGLGNSPLTLSGFPGVVYDERLDAYLVFANVSGSVMTWRVDAASWEVTAPAATAAAPAARTNGLLNAPQYVPELRGVVLANRHDGNVWFMRTSE